MIVIQTDRYTLRDFKEEDATSIAGFANNRKIWEGVRDRFPHPYSEDDAKEFISMVNAQQPATNFAIVIEGKAVGAIGIITQDQNDVYRYSAELGYWIGEPHWGKGLMTDIVRRFSREVFQRYNVWRIYAGVYHTNIASQRVLDKAGYFREGVLRKAAFKDGKVLDEVRFSLLKEDLPAL